MSIVDLLHSDNLRCYTLTVRSDRRVTDNRVTRSVPILTPHMGFQIPPAPAGDDRAAGSRAGHSSTSHFSRLRELSSWARADPDVRPSRVDDFWWPRPEAQALSTQRSTREIGDHRGRRGRTGPCAVPRRRPFTAEKICIPGCHTALVLQPRSYGKVPRGSGAPGAARNELLQMGAVVVSASSALAPAACDVGLQEVP